MPLTEKKQKNISITFNFISIAHHQEIYLNIRIENQVLSSGIIIITTLRCIPLRYL